MQLLADEGFNGFIVRSLREAGFSVEWVLEGHSGVTDEEVIKLAKENQQILLTEDKDFGEWIFAHQITGLTIIFLRYQKEEYPIVLQFLKELLRDLEETSLFSHEFITISRNKVRRRGI